MIEPQALDAYFRELEGRDAYSGVVLITQAQETLFAGAYGYASCAWKIPNTLETRFDTASLTKLFTAVATLQLIDRGLLAFDTPVVDFLGLEGTAISPEVTVYHLLTHTSGIGDAGHRCRCLGGRGRRGVRGPVEKEGQLPGDRDGRLFAAVRAQAGQLSPGPGLPL